MNKLLSIIVPSYNMEHYLPKCLGSLVVDDAELLQRLDVIVVNDGSKDRTSELAHNFEKRYPGVFSVIDKANGHYGSCINAGLKVAKGKYVKVLDADDWFDVRQFKEFLLFIIRIEDVDIVVSDVAIVNANGDELRGRIGLPTDRVFGIGEVCDTSLVLSMHSLTLRRELLVKMKYRQTEGIPYTDGEWCLLPLLAASTFRYFPHTLYMYLKGREGQSVDASVQTKNFGAMVVVLESVKRQSKNMVSRVSEAHVQYLSKWLCDYSHMLYGILTRRVQLCKFGFFWRRIDACLDAMLPVEREMIGEYTVSRKFRFRYLRFIQKHQVLAVPTWRSLECAGICNLFHLCSGF